MYGYNIDVLSQPHIADIMSSLYVKLEKSFIHLPDLKVTILPDFFIDRVIHISKVDDFVKGLYDKINVGGGSLRGFQTRDIKGGNAVNMAYCLAKLGAKIELYTITNEDGKSLLKNTFKQLKNVNLNMLTGKHGLTTIFEFSTSNFSISNVMISDVGDNDNFSPTMVNSKDHISTLYSSNAVVLTNWASNLRGTSLMKHVFSNSSKSVHFIDPADIKERRFEFINDIKNNYSLIDFLSINENEFKLIINAIMDVVPNVFKLKCVDPDFLDPTALCTYSLYLSRFFKIKIIVHTVAGSLLSNGSETIYVPSFKPSQIHIITGAGDSWDSAFLYGHLLNLSVKEKLCFANLYSRLYLENFYSDAPSLEDILLIIKKEYIT